MASPQSPPPAPTSLLLQLPAPLRAIVLLHLPLRCKLTSVAHLCHSFPHLSAAAFRHDHLALSTTSLDALIARPHSLALVAQVRCTTLICNDVTAACLDNEAVGTQLSRLLSPTSGTTPVSRSCRTRPFSSLLVLHCCGINPTSIRTLASCVPPLPLLHTLACSIAEARDARQPLGSNIALLSTWLVELSSLQRLVWAARLSVQDVWFLTSLPHLSLDLRDCRMSISPVPCDEAHEAYTSASLETVSGTLRYLYLPPHTRKDATERSASECLLQLLQRYAEAGAEAEGEVGHVEIPDEAKQAGYAPQAATASKWRLQHLQYAEHCLYDTLAVALSASSSTSLHIASFLNAETLNSFFIAASPTSLPRLSRFVGPTIDVQSRRADETAISEACLAFFPRFAAQLSHLTLTACSPSARACQRLFAAVLTCTRLVSMKFTCDLAVGHPVALPARLQQMSRLQTLEVHSPTHRSERASHLQHAEVARLLEACPALRTLSLTLPNASVSLLATVARACSKMRDLIIRSDDVQLFDMSDELAAAAAAAQASDTAALAHLHTLHCDYYLRAGQSAPQPSAALLSALSSLLCRAPIRRLRLLAHLDAVHLPFYGAFPRLARLRIHDSSLRAILHHYCRQPDQPTRAAPTDTDTRVSRSIARASSGRGWDEDKMDEEGGEQSVEEVWLGYAALVEERLFVVGGRALTGREAWLERARAMAAAEEERRRVAELQRARMAAEEARRQQQAAARKSRKQKAPAGDAADAFFAASGIKRKR